MSKEGRTRRVGEITVTLGTLGIAVLATLYIGLPVAGYFTDLLFGPPPRDPGFARTLAFILITPTIAACPFFVVFWVSNKLFSQYGDNADQ